MNQDISSLRNEVSKFILALMKIELKWKLLI